MGAFRTFLALLVIAGHTYGYGAAGTTYHIGVAAVCVFFVISGYLMPLTFEANYKSNAGKFIVNRALRIYPLYFVALTVLLAALAFGKGITFGANDLVANYLLLGINEHDNLGLPKVILPTAWTLNVELQFYLLLPLILFAVRRSAVWHWVFAASAATCFAILHMIGWSLDIGRTLVPLFLFFYAGFALYVYRIERQAAVASALLAAISLAYSPDLALGAALFAAGAWLLRLQREGFWGRFDQYVGEYSYPLYILHWPLVGAILATLGRDTPYWPLLLINVAACVLASWAALQFVCFPIERLRRRITAGITSAPLAPADPRSASLERQQARP